VLAAAAAAPVSAQEGDGVEGSRPSGRSRTVLQAEAAAGFRLFRIADYPARAIRTLESRFETEITAARAYLFRWNGQDLRVNVLRAGGADAAEALWGKLSDMRGAAFVARDGAWVYEFAVDNRELARRAREGIEFRPVTCGELEGTSEWEYLRRHKMTLDPGAGEESDWLGLGHEKVGAVSTAGQVGAGDASGPPAGAASDGRDRAPRLYLAGEQHGIAENQLLEYAFLTYLHRTAGVRIYLQELPYSAALLLNRYLQTGNDQALETVFQGLSGTYSSSKALFDHYRRLREFNAGLPKEDRIHLVGLDIEHQPKAAFAVSAELTKGLEAPGAYEGLFERIGELADARATGGAMGKRLRKQRHLETAERALEAANARSGWFEDHLGAQAAFDFEIIMENVLNLYRATEAEADARAGTESEQAWNRLRDRMMYENFLRIWQKRPEYWPRDAAIFGQWGLNHVFQAQEFGVEWLAARLDSDEDSPLRGRVVSITYAYDDALQMQSGSARAEPLTSYTPDPGAVLCLATDRLTLYRLDAPDSPYAESLRWMHATPRPEEGVTTDYFQYLVLIRGGTAAEPVGAPGAGP
jgi:erythromycin esterase